MDVADTLVKRIFSSLDLLKESAEKMNQLASEVKLEKHKKNVKTSRIVGSSVTALSAVALTAAGIVAFFTGGAVLPLLVAAGVGALGLGVVTNVGPTAVEAIISSKSMREAKKIGEDIENVFNEIKEHIDTLNNAWHSGQKSQTQDDLRFDSPEDYVVDQILRAMAKDHGLEINDHIKLSNMLMTLNCEDAAGLESGQCLSLLSQFVFKAISKSALKRTAKDVGREAATAGPGKVAASAVTKTVVFGVVGLVFSVPDVIKNSISLAEDNFVTEASQSLRDAAANILAFCEHMRTELDINRKPLQELNDLKNIIENQKRNDDEKKSLMRFAIEQVQEETTRQWLSENSESESFSKLVDMFSFLLKQIDEEKKNHSNSVDITFVAHASIEDQTIPASCLLPLDSIHDVVLFSPWNCFLSVDAAYDIATGSMEPQDRDFYCSSKDCKIPEEKHRPTKLPDEWNSMKKAGGQKIPNIMLSPLDPSQDGAWKTFEELEDEHGSPGRNRILIPFIPEGEEYRIPFFVVSLALSLVLMFSRFQATLHLTACLGKPQQGMKLDEDALKKQYAYTIDKTGMDSLVDDSRRSNEKLYTNLQTAFGDRSQVLMANWLTLFFVFVVLFCFFKFFMGFLPLLDSTV